MRRAWRLAAAGALFVSGLVPFEAKAAALSLVTGAPALTSRGGGAHLARPRVQPRRRPAQLARVETARPSVFLARESRCVPRPALRRLPRRFLRPLLLAADGHRRFLGRERAPPA